MRSVIFAICLLFLSAHAEAADSDWTTQDTVLQVVYTTLHAIDYHQTLSISRRPIRSVSVAATDQRCSETRYTKVRETNVILGDHPTQRNVTIYFAGTLLLHTAVAYVLPKPYRTWFQGLTIAGEGTVVWLNYSRGI